MPNRAALDPSMLPTNYISFHGELRKVGYVTPATSIGLRRRDGKGSPHIEVTLRRWKPPGARGTAVRATVLNVYWQGEDLPDNFESASDQERLDMCDAVWDTLRARMEAAWHEAACAYDRAAIKDFIESSKKHIGAEATVQEWEKRGPPLNVRRVLA